MHFLISVIDDTRGSATADESAAIEAADRDAALELAARASAACNCCAALRPFLGLAR